MVVNLKKFQLSEKNALKNEADVESFFVMPVLKNLGYSETNIKPKRSLKTFCVFEGSQQANYKPDYVLLLRRQPKIIIDAKHPLRSPAKYEGQCRSYSTEINLGRDQQINSVEYFILTNGLQTYLYSVKEKKHLLRLSHDDIKKNTAKYAEFCKYVSKSAMLKKMRGTSQVGQESKTILKKIGKEDAQKLFSSCHDEIHKKDKMSPESAFMEFTKIVCVKLYHDRNLHTEYASNNSDNDFSVPKNKITFSTDWIESMSDTRNPLSDIQYTKLLSDMEDDVVTNNKKRMFSTSDKIDLKPSTIKQIVHRLEKFDFYGIDDDLNGRLFETFLNATMRGKSLGQFFTPRSIVKLAVELADIQVSERHIDKVLDGCCGTGGFLIEALSSMKNKIDCNSSLSSNTRTKLHDIVRHDSIYGIDAAKRPMLAKIARINMYLHGDGGSHIYFADALDRELCVERAESPEIKKDVNDLRDNLNKIFDSGGFDVVLTNPPFSMEYTIDQQTDKRILMQYDLLEFDFESGAETTHEPRTTLKSSVMFLERYAKMLKPGGKLLTIMDETLLSSTTYKYFRDYIRKHFIVKAVISLHGDAFRMSNARVKTSLVYLIKKNNTNDQQPSIFMYPSLKLGIDDLPVTTNKEKINVARRDASAEIAKIVNDFKNWSNGHASVFAVKTDLVLDRLDVKHCFYTKGRLAETWNFKHNVAYLEDLAMLCKDRIRHKDHPTQEFKLMELTYAGQCKTAEAKKGMNIHKPFLQRVNDGDLVISRLNGFHGAIGFVTKKHDRYYVTNEYLVLRPKNFEMGKYLWSILRTTELRCELLSAAVGTGRQRITWDPIKTIQVPILKLEMLNTVTDNIDELWALEQSVIDKHNEITKILDNSFKVESVSSHERFEATKPPH